MELSFGGNSVIVEERGYIQTQNLKNEGI